MAVIRVNPGKFWKPVESALRKARPGDTVVFPSGEYELGRVEIGNIHITSEGNPDDTVIHAYFYVMDNAKFSNVTLKPIENTHLFLFEPNIEIEMESVKLWMTKQKASEALYIPQVRMSLFQVEVLGPSNADCPLFLDKGSFIAANQCKLKDLILFGESEARLEDTVVQSISLNEKSKVSSEGTVTFDSKTEDIAISCDGNSTAVLKNAQFLNIRSGLWVTDSRLSVLNARILKRPPRRIELEGTHRELLWDGVETVAESPAKGQKRQNKPKKNKPNSQRRSGTTTPTSSKGGIITWKKSQSSSFNSVIAPQIVDGCTIQLEPGTYKVDRPIFITGKEITIKGASSPDETAVWGDFVIDKNADVTFKNLKIEPYKGEYGLSVLPHASVKTIGVTFGYSTRKEYVPIVLQQSTLIMKDTTITTRYSDEYISIQAGGHAKVHATRCKLGHLLMHSSVAVLSETTLYSIVAGYGSRCTSPDNVTFESYDESSNFLLVTENSKANFKQVQFNEGIFAGAAVGPSTVIKIDDVIGLPSSDVSCHPIDGAQVIIDGHEYDSDDEDYEDPDYSWSADETEASVSVGGRCCLEDDFASPSTMTRLETSDRSGLEQLNDLVGLSKVKTQIQEFINHVTYTKLRESKGYATTPVTMHSMFLGNPGTGKTTVARLLGLALYEAGVIRTPKFVEVQRGDLVSQYVGETSKVTQRILESALGGVLFIDEAYSLFQEGANQFGQEALSVILKFMEDHRGDIIIIFAGYTDLMQNFISMNPGLKSRVPNVFYFEDYTPDEIVQIGLQDLERRDYEVDPATYSQFVRAEYDRSPDKSNARWVRNFNDKIQKAMAQKALASLADGQTDTDEGLFTQVTRSDLAEAAGVSDPERRESLEAIIADLDNLVGLDAVKNQVRSLINQVNVEKQLADKGVEVRPSTYHMAFLGNPGTGKTTVANILGRLFYALGILNTPNVVVANRQSFISRFVGHTEEKTTQIIEEALGGVLFIDEADQLRSPADQQKDYGQRVIDALIPRLENDRNHFVTIFAGYTEPMLELLVLNPGLRSRIPYIIEFPDYSPEEIGEIAVRMMQDTFSFNEDLLRSKASEMYASTDPKVAGNARWARNFCDRVKSSHFNYVVENNLTGDSLQQISDEVITEL